MAIFNLISWTLIFNPVFAEQKVSLETPVENWSSVFEAAGVAKYYEIQKGDTLYGISATLFGDPHFWPKVWSFNPIITNPHKIKEGNYLYFIEGTYSKPPEFGVSSQAQSGSYLYGKGFVEPIIPPPSVKTSKTAVELPPSLPQIFTMGGLQKKERELLRDVSVGARSVDTMKSQHVLLSEIREELPKAEGFIKVTEDSFRNAKEGDLVTLVSKGSLESGQSYSIFFENEKQNIRKGESKRDFYLIKWVGKLKVKDSLGGDLYSARVTKAYDLIPLGSRVSTEPIKNVEISYSTQEGDLKKLEIIGADALLNNSLVEEGSIVYFNQGSRDGVSEGEIYKLFSDQENFFINKVNSLSRYAALVKIIKSEEDFATGIIYNLKDKLSAKDGYRKNKF